MYATSWAIADSDAVTEIQLLLDQGANVNTEGGCYGNATHSG